MIKINENELRTVDAGKFYWGETVEGETIYGFFSDESSSIDYGIGIGNTEIEGLKLWGCSFYLGSLNIFSIKYETRGNAINRLLILINERILLNVIQNK